MRQDELEGVLGDLWPLVAPYADQVIDGHWPSADEDACFDRSGALAAAAKTLAGVARDGDAAHSAVTACMDGDAAENFTAHWTRFTTRDPQLIPAATRACELAAGRLHRYGADVEYAKYLIVGVLAGLAHRIARLRAMGSASFGGSVGLIPEACAAARIAVQRLAATLVALQADDAHLAGADGAGARALAASAGHAGEPLDDALTAGYVPPPASGPDVTGDPFDGAQAGTAGPAANARTPEFHHLGGAHWHAGVAAQPDGTAGHPTTTPPSAHPSPGTVRHAADTTAPPRAVPPASAGAVPAPGDGGAPGTTRIGDLLNGGQGDGTALASASGPGTATGPGGDGHDHGDGTGGGTDAQAQAPASPPQAPPPMPMFMPVMPMMPSAPSAGGSPKPTPKLRRAPGAAPGNGPEAGGAAASGTGRAGRGGRSAGRGARAGKSTTKKGTAGKTTAGKTTAGKGTAHGATGRNAAAKGAIARGGLGRGTTGQGATGRNATGADRHGAGPAGPDAGSGGRDTAPGDGGSRGAERRRPERDG